MALARWKGYIIGGGTKGEKGSKGDTPEFQAGPNIGSVGTPTVTETVIGSKIVYLLDYLKGSKGDKGDKGDPGIGATTSTLQNGQTGIKIPYRYIQFGPDSNCIILDCQTGKLRPYDDVHGATAPEYKLPFDWYVFPE